MKEAIIPFDKNRRLLLKLGVGLGVVALGEAVINTIGWTKLELPMEKPKTKPPEQK